jgi:hypothetical protein
MKLELLYSAHIHPKNAHGAGVIHPNVERPSLPRIRTRVVGVQTLRYNH